MIGIFVACLLAGLGGVMTWEIGWILWDEWTLWTRFSVPSYEKILVGIDLFYWVPLLCWVLWTRRGVKEKIPRENCEHVENPIKSALEGIPDLPECEIGPFDKVEKWKVSSYEESFRRTFLEES